MDVKHLQDPAMLHSIIDVMKQEVSRLEWELSEAQKDDLTGLPKRTVLTKATQQALSKGKLPVSMIFADLNGFKKINDTSGHDAGDSLLIQFAQFLCEQKENLGEKGSLVVISRLGGDEFAILLPHSLHNEAQLFVDMIKQNLLKKVFSIADGDVIIHSAMGVATTGHKCSTVSELLRNADKAMYLDKDRMSENNETTKFIACS